MAALVREGARLLPSQIGRSQDEDDGEFLDVVVGRFLPGACVRPPVADSGGRGGGVKGLRREPKASIGFSGG